MARRNYSFDANMQLDDGGSAHTAAGWSQVGGANSFIDLGGNQGITITLPSIANSSTITPQQARADLVAVIYISAMTLSGSDLYRLSMVGTNTAGFATATSTYVLGQLQFGEGSAMDAPNAANSHAPAGSGNFPAGDQYELMFTNEVQGTPMEFIGMYVSGTFGSITFQSFVSVLPRE
jgi:hypothetical protein